MKAERGRETSSGTMLLGVAYFALMAFCLWAALGERANARNDCPRHTATCASSGRS